MHLSSNTYCDAALLEPTGGYLTGETITEATRLSIGLNNQILKTPTHPHVGRMYRISFLNHELKWALPSSVFGATSLRQYFLSLLAHHAVNKLINPQDFSARRMRQLNMKYQGTISAGHYTPTDYQQTVFLQMLNLIAKDITTPIKDLEMKLTADHELVVMKRAPVGTMYLLAGQDEADVSFINILPQPGKYDSKHLSDPGQTVESIVNSFLIA